MNDMVTPGVKAFVMIPAGSSAVLEGIEAASKEGIPVCVLDTATTDRTYVASTIVSNNLNAGEISGTAMVDALPDGGKVAIAVGMAPNPRPRAVDVVEHEQRLRAIGAHDPDGARHMRERLAGKRVLARAEH